MKNTARDRILQDLSESQIDIVIDTENNLLVTACPGSGKTRTLTRKLAYMNILYPDSLQKIVAITYTNRAANEIVERLDQLQITESNIWVGTIHQFCLEYILRKFSLNLPRTAHRIKIIDEYTTSKYLRSIYEQLEIRYDPYDHPNLMVTFRGTIIESDPIKRIIVKKYHELLKENKEIDFDLILTLSLRILEDNPTAKQIISNTIRSIFIDEYQDTNEIQYQILGLIAKAKRSINFMFVGDSDQAIYSTLGGVSKSKQEIESITQLEFCRKTLLGCYRSPQNIIDLYSKFQMEPYKINSLAEHSNEPGIIEYDKSTHKDNLPKRISEIITNSLDSGVSEDNICVIAPNQYILSPLAQELKILLPEIRFRSQDIYPIKPDDFNLFYKISFLVFTEPGKRTRIRKNISKEIIESLKYDFKVTFNPEFNNTDFLDIINSVKSNSSLGLDFLNEKIESLFSKINISEQDHATLYAQKNDFIEKAQDRIKNPRLNLSPDIDNFRNIYKAKTGINISTIHKVKGEEYDVVIAFGFLQDTVPHFKSIKPYEEASKLIYVTISRAKKQLFIFSERGRKNGNYPEKKPTIILENAITRR